MGVKSEIEWPLILQQNSLMTYPQMVAWNGQIVLQQAIWYQTMPIMFGADNFYNLNNDPRLALSHNPILNT